MDGLNKTDEAVEDTQEVDVKAAGGDKGSSAAQSVDELPQWAQRELKQTRDEAAKYRTANKELVEKMSSLKSAEDVEAAVAEAKAEGERMVAQIALERDRAIVRGEFPQIPDEVFSLIQGGCADELREAAGRVSEHFGKRAVSPAERAPGGGLDPSVKGDDFDVDAAVAAIPRY